MYFVQSANFGGSSVVFNKPPQKRVSSPLDIKVAQSWATIKSVGSYC